MKKYLAILVVLAPLGTLGVVSVVQLRSEVAALRVDNARLAQPLTETQPYLVDLPHFPALGGVVRPQSQQWLATGDELCFDARQAHQWFSALNRALGGKR